MEGGMRVTYDCPPLIATRARIELTQVAFCAHGGIHPISFSGAWRRLRRQAAAGGSAAADPETALDVAMAVTPANATIDTVFTQNGLGALLHGAAECSAFRLAARRPHPVPL